MRSSVSSLRRVELGGLPLCKATAYLAIPSLEVAVLTECHEEGDEDYDRLEWFPLRQYPRRFYRPDPLCSLKAVVESNSIIDVGAAEEIMSHCVGPAILINTATSNPDWVGDPDDLYHVVLVVKAIELGDARHGMTFFATPAEHDPYGPFEFDDVAIAETYAILASPWLSPSPPSVQDFCEDLFRLSPDGILEISADLPAAMHSNPFEKPIDHFQRAQRLT